MTKYLTTNSLDGSFDFISNIIVLEKYDERYKLAIEEAVNINLFDEITLKYDQLRVDILSIIYHEITHFLDMTTTSWGLEYNIRKTNHILNKNSNADEVFKLNVAEIEMHHQFINIINKDINLLDCTTEHGLLYDKQFGSLVLVIFFLEYKKIEVEAPISMLSIIEANAYAVENLIKIRSIEIHPDINEQKILMIELEKDMEKFLNNTDFIEYNMIIILCKKHFDYLILKELFQFIHVLIRYVLDMGMYDLGYTSKLLSESFINKEIGNAIAHDINRGMSRHIIVFKFILIMHGYITNHTDKLFLMQLQKEKPLDFIETFCKSYNIPITTPNNKHIKDYFINIGFLNKKSKIFDTDIILKTSKKNRNSSNPILDLRNLSEYLLLDIFLNDSTIIKMPNRLDIDINEYTDKEVINLDYIEFDSDKIIKFHVRPNDVPREYYNYE